MYVFHCLIAACLLVAGDATTLPPSETVEVTSTVNELIELTTTEGPTTTTTASSSSFTTIVGDKTLDTTSKNCTVIETNEMTADLNVCFDAAERHIVEGIIAGDILGGLCKTIEEKADCQTKIRPRCQSEYEAHDYRLGYLEATHDKLINDTDDRSTVLKTCPIFNTFYEEWLLFVTGATTCTYKQYNYRVTRRIACNKVVTAKRDDQLELLKYLSTEAGRFLREVSYCKAYFGWNECLDQVLPCVSKNKEEELRESLQESYNDIEDFLHSLGIANFKFEHCKPSDTVETK